MELIIKLQSISDIITNSSSETFVINNSEDFKTLCEIIENIGKNNYFKGTWEEYDKLSELEKEKYDTNSGDGGNLKISNWKDQFENYKKWYINSNKYEQFTPEIWSLFFKESLDELKKTIWIDIDHNRIATINWIIKNLWVKEVYSGYYRKDPKTGRIIERITYDEWLELSDSEKDTEIF